MSKGVVTAIIIIVFILLIGGGWLLLSGNHNQAGQYSSMNNPSNGASANGTIYMSFKDAAVNMGNVSAVDMTVDKIYVHSESQGWVTVSTNPQTFSLLNLKASGAAQLMATATVAADTYDQAWFHISGATVTETGKTAKAAALPSGDFKMAGTLKVTGGTSSVATFDVLADQSLHKTSKSEFVFAPVVNFESRENAMVGVNSYNILTITGGTVDSNTSAGMDSNGEVKANFKLDANVNLQINGGVINVLGAAGTTTGVSGSAGY